MSHSRHVSTSSYAYINPYPRNPSESTTSLPTYKPKKGKITHPYPLIFLALIDGLYTSYQAFSTGNIDKGLLALCLFRVGVEVGLVGMSKYWRNRGGWVAFVCGISVGMVVWTICKGQLEQGKADHGSKGGHGGGSGNEGNTRRPLQMMFLAVTAGISILEYLTFLLLLRLSPPIHRPNPLSLRLPNSAVQNPTAFSYTSTSTTYKHHSSSPLRNAKGHQRHTSRSTLLRPNNPNLSQSPTNHNLSPHHTPLSTRSYSSNRKYYDAHSDIDDGAYHGDYDTQNYSDAEDEDGDEDEDEDEEYFSDSSSISESSIIDLPPPLSPSRIKNPPSLGMNVNRGLDIFSTVNGEGNGVIGAVVRRTKSARFLGRSWGSGSGSGVGSGHGVAGGGVEASGVRNGEEVEEDVRDGYGTFGMG